MDAIAQKHQPSGALRSLIQRVRTLMAERGAHAARTMILVPYAQLMPVARRAWAEQLPTGFAPRIETTMNWSAAVGFVPRADDVTFDMGRDLLTARGLLERAGLSSRADLLATRLVEAAWQLGNVAAAVSSRERAAWAAKARGVATSGDDMPLLALEAAVASIALAWAAASGYASDALLGECMDGVDLLVLVEGLKAEPLTQALKSAFPGKAVAMGLEDTSAGGEVRLHEAEGPSDEAERAAACVLRHLLAGRTPVAVAAVDRVLTRRIGALLEVSGVPICDETGWKLSTTRAAAHVMLALRGCAWNAASDVVIDWLKNSPATGSRTVLALERRVRQAGVREWRSLQRSDLGDASALHELLQQVNAGRDGMQRPRPLAQWLASLRSLLAAAGQWEQLEGDAAGAKVIAVLRLAEGAQAEFEGLPQACRRLDLQDFTSWVGDSLEAGSFVPSTAGDAQVVILPFNQVVGRAFPAVVLPGCDETRLAPAPEPEGQWSAAQRRALGLSTREQLESEVRAGWRQALRAPHCDVLWRRCDESGEPLLPSPLVQALHLGAAPVAAMDPRDARDIDARPTIRPAAAAKELAIRQLSASAYEDLRRCPYRFFSLRLLGLQEADEIDAEIDKREFGSWLHQVLRRFHESLARVDTTDRTVRLALLDDAATATTQALRLEPGEFLPFSAAWPQVREGYLTWLAEHEAQGAVFEEAESERVTTLGNVRLVGRIDRIDRMPDGALMVMDYKTEAAAATGERVSDAAEDTQLAFYAALMASDTLRAAYVNVGERGKTATVEQVAVLQARDLLTLGISDDLQRIGDGATLEALGEGRVCDYCAARGLCRRDFWA
jgi:ATP-dependent helicase/nuclease subunit B